MTSIFLLFRIIRHGVICIFSLCPLDLLAFITSLLCFFGSFIIWTVVKKRGGVSPAGYNSTTMQFFVTVPGDADGLFSGSDEVAMETVEMRDGENETK